MKKTILIISVISILIAAPTHAKLEGGYDIIRVVPIKYVKATQSKSISAQQAARLVKSKYGGKVLKVNSSGSKKNPSYRVKLLKKNGHVISVNVDAKSGRVSGR
jgi:uncharacterized membrane protein YkoI